MLLIIIIIVLVIIYYIKSVNVNDDTYFLYKNSLSRHECEELIHMSKKYTLETKLDTRSIFMIPIRLFPKIYTQKQYIFIINISRKNLHT